MTTMKCESSGVCLSALLIKILMVALVATLVGMFIYAVSLPTVEFSYSTKECVRIIESDGSVHLCPDDLPEKYLSSWVK